MTEATWHSHILIYIYIYINKCIYIYIYLYERRFKHNYIDSTLNINCLYF